MYFRNTNGHFQLEPKGARVAISGALVYFTNMPDDALPFPDVSKIFPQSEQKRVKPLQVSISGDRPRVLLADDDPVHSLTIHHFLSQAGYDVVVAVTGTDAIAELRRADHPSVAILRAKLPEMDGIEICARMRKAAKYVYTIVYSERPTSPEIVAGLEAGADLYIARSTPPEELLAHVKVGVRIISRQQDLAKRLEQLSGQRSNE
jgi:PleD family two-component response regulator